AFDRGQMAVTIFRAKICDFDDLLQRPRAAHQFAIHRSDGRLVERSLVRFENVLVNFLFSCWRKDFRSLVVLDLADFAGELRTFVDQLEELKIEFVDLMSQTSHQSLGLCRRQLFVFARHKSLSHGRMSNAPFCRQSSWTRMPSQRFMTPK